MKNEVQEKMAKYLFEEAVEAEHWSNDITWANASVAVRQRWLSKAEQIIIKMDTLGYRLNRL